MKKPVLFCLMLLSSLFLMPGCDGGQPREQVYDIVVYGGTVGRRGGRGAGRPDGQQCRADRARRAPGRAHHRRAGRDRHRQQGGDRRDRPRVLPARSASTTRIPTAWEHEQPEAYASGRGTETLDEPMWTFEPHVAERRWTGFIERGRGAGGPRRAAGPSGRGDRRAARIVAISDGDRADFPRQDVHRRHLRRRPDGHGRRVLHGRPRGQRQLRRNAQRRADRPCGLPPVHAAGRSLS